MPKKTKRAIKSVLKKEELLKFMDRVPPCLVRVIPVVASRPNRRTGNKLQRCKPIRDIVKDSGLNRRNVQRIAAMNTWDGVDIGDADKFLKGCNVDIFNTEEIMKFIKEYADFDFPHLTEVERARLYNLLKWK